MKNPTKSIKIGIGTLLSGLGLFWIITFLMNHGFLMDYGYLIHYQSQKTASFVYTRSVESQFTNEITQWGIFGYLRIGFLIIGFSGLIYLIINGAHIFLKRKK